MKTIIARLQSTSSSIHLLVLRLALGIVILPHGLQKVFGWFGGGGWLGTMQYMDKVGVAHWLAVLVILTESLGAIALLAGVFTRLAALAIGVELTVAAVMIHLPRGFFMDWHSQHQGEGYEFHILGVAIAAALLLCGGGALSIDRLISYPRRN